MLVSEAGQDSVGAALAALALAVELVEEVRVTEVDEAAELTTAEVIFLEEVFVKVTRVVVVLREEEEVVARRRCRCAWS